MANSPGTIQDEREKHPAPLRDTLWVTDEELIRRLGVPRRSFREAVHVVDRDKSKGFPQKQPLWGRRRYWPAVRAWFDLHYLPYGHKRSI